MCVCVSVCVCVMIVGIIDVGVKHTHKDFIVCLGNAIIDT